MGNWSDNQSIVPLGGLNTKAPPDLIDESEAVEFVNIDTSNMTMKKRGGTTRVTPTALPMSSLVLDRKHALSISHHPIGQLSVDGDLTLTDYWTIECVIRIDATDIGYHAVDETGIGSDPDQNGVVKMSLLQKGGFGGAGNYRNNYYLYVTNSDNGGNTQSQAPGASEGSEGTWKVWLDYHETGGTERHIHPTESSHAGGYVSLNPGTTYHILVSKYTAGVSDTVSIWVNGLKHGQITGVTLGAINSPKSNSLKIGWHAYNSYFYNSSYPQSRPRRPFIGRICELRIRNSTGMRDVNISTYYSDLGTRGLLSTDDADYTQFDDESGGQLSVWSSLSAYIRLNEGSGTPAFTKGCGNPAGSEVAVYSYYKTCSWADGIGSGDASVRFDEGMNGIFVPNGASYRDLGLSGLGEETREVPDLSTYRIRFHTPKEFFDDSSVSANNPHKTLMFASTVSFATKDTPNTYNATDKAKIWFWLRLRQHSTAGDLELIVGDYTSGGTQRSRSTSLGPLTADKDYCAIFTLDYTGTDPGGADPYVIKLWVIEDPEGTPVVTTATNTNALGKPKPAVGDDYVNKYPMFIGGLPVSTVPLVKALDEDVSFSTEDPNAIGAGWDFQDNTDQISVDEVSIWNDLAVSSDSEAKALAIPLTGYVISSYGSSLLSHWAFTKGSGNFVEDKGALGNHLSDSVSILDVISVNTSEGSKYWGMRESFFADNDIRWGTALVDYETSGSILMLKDYRRRVGTRSIVVGGPGGLYVVDESTGVYSKIFDGFAGASNHWQSFVFGDYLFAMTGGSSVLKLVGDVGFFAGIDPPVYLADVPDMAPIAGVGVMSKRIKTYLIGGNLEKSSSYLYTFTYFSASSAVESPPGPIMQVQTGGDLITNGVLFGWDGSIGSGSHFFPKPTDKQVTHVRMYRSVAGGSTLFFEEQFPIGSDEFISIKADSDLGDPIDAFFNNKPPKVTMGTIYRGRAYYSGNPDNPQRLYASRVGFPEYVPTTYFVDLVDDNGNGIPVRMIKAYRDRIVVATDQGTYLVVDRGGDISLDSPQDMPISIVPIQFDDGCVGRSAVCEIGGRGILFAGQNNIYSTQGEDISDVNGKIQPTYDAFSVQNADAWIAAHWREKKYAIFAISSGGDTTLDRFIVVEYDKPGFAFGVWEIPDFTVVAPVRRSTDDKEEIWIGDGLGYLSKFNESAWDGYISGATSSGTATGGSTTTAILGTDLSGLSGDGVRGLQIAVFHASGTLERRIIYSHSTVGGNTTVTVSEAFDNAVTAGDTWFLGLIRWSWETGYLLLGSTAERTKKLHHLNVEQAVPATSGSYVFGYAWFGENYNEFAMSNQVAALSLGPFYGSGTRLSLKAYGETNTPAEIKYVDLGFFVKARRNYA